MKKFYHRIFMVGIALASCSSFQAFANFDIDKISYQPITEETCQVVYCPTDNRGDIVIPEKVTDPESGQSYTVTAIGAYAFEDCTGITSIQLPESIELIDTRAFFYCSGLTTVTLPASLKEISFHVFGYCSNLESINVAEGNEYFKSIDGILYDKAGEVVVMSPEMTGPNITIPEGVKEIGHDAFYNNTNLISVSLPEGLEKLSTGAFQQCESLREINCPNSLEYIGAWAFDRCFALEEFTAGEGLKTIDSASFEYCYSLHTFNGSDVLEYVGEYSFMGAFDLRKVYLGKNIDWIGALTFTSNEDLEEVIILNPTAPEISEDAFADEQYAIVTIYVDEEALSSFKETFPWSKFQKIVPYANSGLKNVGDEGKLEVTTNGGILEVSSDGEILLFDADGRLISCSDRKLTIPLPSGLYIVKSEGQIRKVLL